MNIYNISFTLIIFVFLSSCTNPNDKWYVYKSENSEFIARFPNPPYEKSNISLIEGELIETKLLMLDSEMGDESRNISYILSYSEVSNINLEEDLAKKDYKAFFNDLIQGTVNGMYTKDGKLEETHVIYFQGNEGRDVNIKFKDDQYICIVRFILNENTLYTLYVSTDIQNKSNPDIQRFFNSFKLL